MTTIRTSAKAKARRLADRIALPYVDLLTSSLLSAQHPNVTGGPVVDAVPHATTEFFHLANHELRTLELERLPKGAKRVLSVGANGRWYFDWFEAAVGHVDEHLGIEAYEPKPDDLQSYVTWIPDTADHMTRVADETVDLVFAGQTTEHLWSYELAGFLEEAHRVLRANGLLVLDSPNRLVTEQMLWSHGGHTVELSPGEIVELITLAGFDVDDVHGLWGSRLNGRVLQLEEQIEDPAIFVRRAASGREAPDDAFVWWVNARKAPRKPDRSALRTRSKQIFDQHWDTRINRGLFPSPGSKQLEVAAGSVGRLGETLTFPLKAGPVELTVALANGSWDDLGGFRVDLVTPGDFVVRHLPIADAIRTDKTLSWSFDQPELTFTVAAQFIVDSVSAAAAIALPFHLKSDI